ncbi:energy-coupling factor transporter transmembrane component T family protein [Desmospora activa]|uniref:Energy-coupling factor transport system permease protein n=1 Tax=Desmospora activa DSM 45169 TaxID=1121389 RepID=A0A2T4ZBY4_9BACL|nr:energy-coupling factor transporter transmembrane component T [Desmospora activa]PTM59403.1 energy-coupling factor transport system permease protein [Desmospora activa DSM 45169]
MSRMGTLYIPNDTFFHRLDGSIKLLLFLVWTIVTFLFLDMRIFVWMLVLGIILITIAKIPFRAIRLIVWMMITFNLLNSVFILLITPAYGTELTGSATPVLQMGAIGTIYLETIHFVLTLSLKYLTLLPITFIFIYTTHPSLFACSLNRIGVPYKIAYALNIAFRYIPDIQTEIKHILHSQQARGMGFQTGEAPLLQRIRNVTSLVIPLITSSLQRIEVVSNAMELRGFGKHPRRTWYHATPLQAVDFVVAALSILALGAAIFLKVKLSLPLWYPF